MVFTVHSCALLGLEPHAVACEVDLACQLPNFSLVGLPSSLTRESRDRVRAAIVNSGFDWPARKVTINLLPASLPKWGSHFELAMALGVLGASLDRPAPLHVLAMGELSLSGEVRPCRWLVSAAAWIRKVSQEILSRNGEPLVLIAHPHDLRELNRAEPSLAQFVELCDAHDLRSANAKLCEALARASSRAPNETPKFSILGVHELHPGEFTEPSFQRLRQVKNEPLATVAALVAVAGKHSALFAGPQGMGKSMVIGAICEATPELSESQQAERTALLSSFGEGFATRSSLRKPVVALQTSISRAALEGALLESGQVLPGELTRAHLGILVADELLEFRRDVIEALRQPLDEGMVRLQRAKFRTVLPARVQFLASTNLCPCGACGGSSCSCSETVRKRYQSKLSGPIVDRFDLAVIVGRRTTKVREPQIPRDLEPLVDELLDSKRWDERMKWFRDEASYSAADKTGEDDPATLWSAISTSASDRGKLKLSRVSRTIARLLGEPRRVAHLRLALLLRQDLEAQVRALRLRAILPRGVRLA